jgi:hypothetical protein
MVMSKVRKYINHRGVIVTANPDLLPESALRKLKEYVPAEKPEILKELENKIVEQPVKRTGRKPKGQ